MDKQHLDEISDLACSMHLQEDGCGGCKVCEDVAECLAELTRLQALVKVAYREGGQVGYILQDDYCWNRSKAKQALAAGEVEDESH